VRPTSSTVLASPIRVGRRLWRMAGCLGWRVRRDRRRLRRGPDDGIRDAFSDGSARRPWRRSWGSSATGEVVLTLLGWPRRHCGGRPQQLSARVLANWVAICFAVWAHPGRSGRCSSSGSRWRWSLWASARSDGG